MNIQTVLDAVPVITGGTGDYKFSVVVIDHRDGESWFFVDHGRTTVDIRECSGESEAMSLFDEADASTHAFGCRCHACFDPWLDDRRRTYELQREWA